MVSVRKRKMKRSSVKKNTRKNHSSNTSGRYNPKSNPVIAKHWDSTLTAKQNYKKLGLTFKIGATTGGEEKKIVIGPINRGNMEESLFDDAEEDEEEQEEQEEEQEGFDPYDPMNIIEGTAKIMKDDNGKVIKIVYGTKKLISKQANHNKDSENRDSENEDGDDGDDDDAEDEEDDQSEARQVIAELEELSRIPKKKEVHKMNELEQYRYKKLIEKYGQDYERMKWDKKLNPFQLSPGQLRKEIKRYSSIYA